MRQLTLQGRGFLRIPLLATLLVVFLACTSLSEVAAQAPRPPAPAPFAPLSLAVADFSAVGVEPSLAAEATQVLREALNASPLVAIKGGAGVQQRLSAAVPKILSGQAAVANTVAKEVDVRLLAMGLVGARPDGGHFLQVIVADCRPRVARLYATEALAWPQAPAARRERVLSALQSVLPPVGRVLAIINTNGEVEYQLFPFAGVPLRTETTYLTFRALAPEESAQRPDYLPILWPGAPGGRLVTTAERHDDVITAGQEGEGRVEIGDLVYVRLTDQISPLPAPAHLLLSDPPFAQVQAGRRVLGVTPLLVSAADAPAELELALEDYERQPVRVAAAAGVLEAQSHKLSLLPPHGILAVTTDPEGATIMVGTRTLGETPLTYPGIPIGEQTIVVSLHGYHETQQKVEIRRAQETRLEVKLERQMRPVRLVTRPAGAEVFWNGEVLGKAPANVERATVGKHQLRVVLPGYDEITEEVEVPPGTALHELTFELTKRVGRLAITTQPPGARVTVAGQPRAAAPLELADLPPGEYEITAVLEGYRPLQRTATVKAHETTRVEIVLARKIGTLDIKTIPTGAEITIDGQERGTTPARIEDLPAGEHTLKLELPNLRPWQGKVTVKDGEVTEVQVGLLPLQLEMSTGPPTDPTPAQPVPTRPTPPQTAIGTTAPRPPTVNGEIRDFEGTEVPPSLPLMDLTTGERRTWTLRLQQADPAPQARPNAMQLDFQPRADGGLNVGLRVRDALPHQFPVETNGGRIVVDLPGLKPEHNPAGYQISSNELRGVTVTNGGPDGAARIEFLLGSGAQVSLDHLSPGRELNLTLRRPLPVSGQKLVALTFDDTPFPGRTERLLQILAEQQVVATFFVIGRKAADHPELVRRAYEAGHSIENHTHTHPRLSDLALAEVESELRQCNEVLQRITGTAPRYYRPPGGQSNSQVHRVAERLGLRYAAWDVNARDYDAPSAQHVQDRVLSQTRRGDIILLHDGVEATMQALPGIIRQLRERGVVFVTLDQLLQQ